MKKFEPNQSGGCYKNVCIEDSSKTCPRSFINCYLKHGKLSCREVCNHNKLKYTTYDFRAEKID